MVGDFKQQMSIGQCVEGVEGGGEYDALRAQHGHLLGSVKRLQMEFCSMNEYHRTATGGGQAAGAGLAERQAALLTQVQGLQRSFARLTRHEGCPAWSDQAVPHEVVVHCCPAAPPFCALPAVAALRGSGLRVAVCTATHSSLPKSTEIPAYLETLFTSSQGKARADHHIVLRLVWAEGAPQTRVSPLHQSPIVGHANLLRYLCRLLPANSELNYEAAPLRVVSATDAVLDLCEAALGGDAAAVLALMDGAVANRRGGGAGDVMLWAALRGMAQRGGVFRPLLDWKQEMDRAYLLSDGTGDAARAAELRQALQDLLKAEGRV